jgi:hypothetical protein
MSKAGAILERLKRFGEFVRDRDNETPMIRGVLADHGDGTYQRLDEGKWIDGRLPKGIRLDQPTYMKGGGQVHGHVYGRKGQEFVVVNFDGTGSHGSKGRLHPDDARALRARGFRIRHDRIVEWLLVPNPEGIKLILG